MAHEKDIGDCRLILADCMDLIGEIADGVAVVTDPPYGIGIRSRVNWQAVADWDRERIDIAPWLDIGTHHLIWGAQYYADLLPVSEAWMCWVKRPLDGISKRQNHTTIELAWTDYGKPRFHKQVWDGGKREGRAENRTFCHPTQKPVELMEACLDGLPPGCTVVDPFMGSGTTGLACLRRGHPFIGIESDPQHYETAVERIRSASREPMLL